MFRFKQFTVHDEACGLKVGTDAVLLGTEQAPLPKPSSPTGAEGCLDTQQEVLTVLDVGTGSGVVALMLAQRFPKAEVWGIDIDEAAIRQAEANFAESPFANRLHAKHISLQELAALPTTYSLIVSNPPYFVNSLKNPDEAKRTARHTDTLSFEDLIAGAHTLLCEEGLFQVILPTEAEESFMRLAASRFCLLQRTTIQTSPRKSPKRVILTLQKGTLHFALGTKHSALSTMHFALSTKHYALCTLHFALCLTGPNGEPRSEAYAARCQEFYL